MRIMLMLIMAIFIVVGCGQGEKEQVSGNEPKEQVNENERKEPIDEVDETINEEDTSIEVNDFSLTFEQKENRDAVFELVLTNISGDEINLMFPSMQEFDYVIKDENGKIIYEYGVENAFGLALVEKTLKPNVPHLIDIDLREVLSTVGSGTFTIEAWVTGGLVGETVEPFKREIQLTLEESFQPYYQGVYVGQIDQNSVEIIDEYGVPQAYFLTDSVRESIKQLDENENIQYRYKVEKEQVFLLDVVLD